MRRLERKRNISTNKDTLGESYKPGHIEECDDKISEYMDALQPAASGWEPNNVFLHGNTGVRKAAVTGFLLEMLLEDVSQYDSVGLSVVSVNCRMLNPSCQMVAKLVNELQPPGAVISSTGYPQQTVFRELSQELDDMGGTVLIVLDEVDSIGDHDELLYELPRACSSGKLENAEVDLIGISDDFEFHDRLDPCMQDTLCERKLHFPPYQAPGFQNIFESHAEVTITEGAYEEDVLNLCATLAARDSRSARQALDLLRLTGEHIESKNGGRITLDHVDIVRQKLEQERIIEGVRELTENGHFALLAVVSKAAHNETPCRMRDLYQEYLRLCNSAGIDPLAQRSVHNHLSDLRMLGILSAEENQTGSRGNYHSYALNVPFSSAMGTLFDTPVLDSVLDGIRKAVMQAEAA